MIKKIVEIAHDYLLENNCLDNIAIDFTCGSGNDTKVLALNMKHVYSYDIQEEPILEAKQLCKELSNISFYCKSHIYFDEDVTKFDRGIFNLGYYPKGDKNITTNFVEVIQTIEKALDKMNSNGRLIIVCYPGFESGYIESLKIEEYVQTLSSKKYDVFKFQLMNRKNAPYIIGIDKH